MRRILLAALSAVASLALAIPALAVVTGPDVSSYQHPSGASIAWGNVAAAGQSFVMVKATEGTGYTNPYFSVDTAQAARAGMVHGAYDFVHPDQSAVSQADYFASVIGSQNQPGDLPPLMDLEETGGLSAPALISWVNTWLTTVAQLTHRTPMIYVSPYFWIDNLANTKQFAGYPLWVADYCGCSQPMAFGGWGGGWTFWQYTDAASMPLSGGGSTTVDESFFNGSLAVLRDNYAGENLTPSKTPVNITATPSATAIYTNNWLTVSGTVSPSQGADIVTLWDYAGGTWHACGWATVSPGANNTGTYSTLVDLPAPGTYPIYAQVAANVVHAAGSSASFNVKVTNPPPAVVTASVSPTTVIVGNHVTVSGTVSPGSAGNPVDVQMWLYGSWHVVARPTTDSAGDYSASVLAGVLGTFSVRAVAPATLNYATGVSPGLTLTSNPPPPSTVTVAMTPTTTVAGSHVTVSGTVSPASAGNPVDVQMWLNGSWHVVARPTTDSAGHYSASVLGGVVGTFPIRAYARATSSYSASTSSDVTLTANPEPKDAAVTAQLSPSVTVAGSTVTVSGTVTPAGAGNPVSVQMWLFGSWHIVARTTTTATGHYSTTVYDGLAGTFPLKVVAEGTTVYLTMSSPRLTLVGEPITGTTVTATLSQQSVTAGSRVKVSGVISPSGAGASLLAQMFLYGSWHNVATATADSAGAYQASVYAGVAGTFPIRVLAPATGLRAAVISSQQSLQVALAPAPRVTASPATNPVPLHSRVLVRGTVTGASPGERVVAEGYFGNEWHNLASAVTDSNGNFGASVYWGLRGTFPVEVIDPATTAHPVGVSPAFSERVY